MKTFQQKVVVITGAGSGIGRALSLQFAAEGAKLALNDFNASALDETAQLVRAKGAAVFTQAFDVSKKEDMFAFADAVAQHYGQVDVVINNAGVALGQVRVENTVLEDVEWIVGINQWGVVYGTLAFLPFLKKQPEAALVNLSSVFGLAGIATQSAYCMTKFAVRGFTESMRMECLGSNLTITTIHPGGVDTNIVNNSRDHNEEAKTRLASRFKMNAKTTPDSAAAQIISGIRRKKVRVVIGKDGKMMDWLVRIFPSKYSSILFGQMRRAKLSSEK